MTVPLKVGIIGWGKMGHLRADVVSDHPDLDLVAVADVRDLPADLPVGVRYTRTPQAIFEHGLDIAFVCTPNAVTPGMVVAALESGCHVFAEKPPGRSVADVHAIRAAEDAAPGQRLQFGFNHRHHAAVLEALEIVRSGRLGRVLWMRGLYGKGWSFGSDVGWRSQRSSAGGGILLDQGIHMLDLFRAFGGDFTEIKSFVGGTQPGLEDNAFALLRNAAGQVAVLHSSATQWKHLFSLEVFMTDGYVSIDGFLTGSRSYGRESLVVARRPVREEEARSGRPREEVAYFDRDRSWWREVDAFVRAIRNDVPVGAGNSGDALKAMELVESIYRADPSWWKGLEDLDTSTSDEAAR